MDANLAGVRNFPQQLRDLIQKRSGPVLVMGAGTTGVELSNFFSKSGAETILLDEREVQTRFREKLPPNVRVFESLDTNQPLPAELAQSCLAVASPGISPRGTFYQAVKALGVKIVSEVDIGITFLGMPKIGVTGTDGKSTVATLIQHLLVTSGIPTELVGNVGSERMLPFIPHICPNFQPTSVVADGVTSWRSAVAEYSSYQLETVHVMRPQIGVWLNLGEDHLERHGDMDAYLAAKARLFLQQTEDCWSLLPFDHRYSGPTRALSAGRFFGFGSFDQKEAFTEAQGSAAIRNSDCVVVRYAGVEHEFSLQKFRPIGEHNALNAAASLAVAVIAGANPQALRSGLESFEPLEHRLEQVQVEGSNVYINDSKATSVHAAVADLRAVAKTFAGRNLVVLIGGKMKRGAWDVLRDELRQSAAYVIGFGGDGPAVLKELGFTPVSRPIEAYETGEPTATLTVLLEPTLSQAIGTAVAMAEKNSIVVLLPACASFDEFSDFSARGRFFKQRVRELVGR